MTPESRRAYKAEWNRKDRLKRAEGVLKRAEGLGTGLRPRFAVVVEVLPTGSERLVCVTAAGDVVRAGGWTDGDRPPNRRDLHPIRRDDVVRLTWKVNATLHPDRPGRASARARYATTIVGWEAVEAAHCINAAYEYLHGPKLDERRKRSFNTIFAALFQHTTDTEKELMALSRGQCDQWQFPRREGQDQQQP